MEYNYSQYNYIDENGITWTVLYDENENVVLNEDGTVKSGYQWYLEWLEENKEVELTTEEKIEKISTEITELKETTAVLEECYYGLLLEL